MRALAVVPLLLGAACTSQESDDPDAAAPASPTASATVGTPGATAATPEPTAVTPDPTGEAPESAEEPAEVPLPPVVNPVSLPALMQEEFTGSRLRTLRVLGEAETYTRSQVIYRSGGVRVSGVLLRPKGRGPFPAVVLNHGHIEPSIYVTGQGLAREQERLVTEGYVVLHTDYRGHAASDPAAEDTVAVATRLGYIRDSINAVKSLEREPYVDRERIAMLGRSMGGGVTLGALVAQPGLVDAAIVYASVSSDHIDNMRRWQEPEQPGATRRLYREAGAGESFEEFYAGLSPRTYVDRITEPVLMFHGTSDDSCPVAWSRTTHRALRDAGVDSRLVVYPGEEHAFVPRWEDSIRATLRFLDQHLA